MAKINVENVTVLDNPSAFLNPFQFEITFECIENLPDDLEWKLTYVGSAESEEFDQVLDTVLVGPVPEGRHKFVFQADPPDPRKIPKNECVGVTVILLSCAYKGKEFIKIGYFVASDYEEPELKENPPENPVFEKLKRTIVVEEPRVTRLTIPWDDAEPTEPTDGGETSGHDQNQKPSILENEVVGKPEPDQKIPVDSKNEPLALAKGFNGKMKEETTKAEPMDS